MNGSQDEGNSEPLHVLHRGDLLRGVPCRFQAASRRSRVWAEQTRRLRGLTSLAAGASLRGVVARCHSAIVLVASEDRSADTGSWQPDGRTHTSGGKRNSKGIKMKAMIVGAGIGGLTTALFLNKYGIDCEVFEQAPAIQELGVGINLMPHAIASFDERDASGAGAVGHCTRPPPLSHGSGTYRVG